VAPDARGTRQYDPIMRGKFVGAGLLVLAGVLAACSSGGDDASPTATVAPSSTVPPATTTAAPTTTTVAAEDVNGPAGTQRLHFEYGPITIQPGQNSIELSNRDVPKPTEDGWILRIAPNLRYGDGTVPPVDVIHLHHGVWVNISRPDATAPNLPERFFAAGEEKTITNFPPGYGYRYEATDRWLLSYMIHDLTPRGTDVWITYDLDFLPATSREATSIQPARPIWMDVHNGSPYPVFDVIKGSGTDGTFTYPDQAADPYKQHPPANVWTVDRDGVLIGTGGHLHPGGLYDDLWIERANQTAHLFRAEARYFEPAGAVSWDVATTVTAPSWRVAVHAGDSLRITSTYDTTRSSWYESMGIMVAWMADAPTQAAVATTAEQPADAFTTPVDQPGVLTHGHLPENDNHGGTGTQFADPTERTTAPASAAVGITDFVYAAGDLSTVDAVPAVKPGDTLTFHNNDAPIGPGIWHTITSCRAPCNATTGVAYPLADGDIAFDSGELGIAGPPTAGRVDWQTPADLAPGLYTYFCRIHPFMRGAFSVTTG
jgi:plastocyanin